MIDSLALVVILSQGMQAPATRAADVDDDAAQRNAAAQEISQALLDGKSAHLRRVAAVGTTSVLSGSALMGTTAALTELGVVSEPELFGVGAQAVGWGVINLAIVGVSVFFLEQEVVSLDEAAEQEQSWRTILLVNEGLNVSYIAGGLGMVGLGLLPIPAMPPVLAAQLRGHGLGIAIQGGLLLFLDGIAILESYRRQDDVDAALAAF